ncbi:hypothetical protein RvY_05047 [Ramazzottius varieornatus]|uniref:MARVEL domain-containing protein n=1 Tax=Ramazzottius varieornatus TaxID=947166 RepID=A0A1D1UTP8_RAMVA|nr:hypothetical protein RvY_05047 [Ramazzottius varieornatus]
MRSQLPVPSSVGGMDEKHALYLSEYNKNNYCTLFVIIVNVLTGFGVAAIEIAQLTYVWNLPHLKYRIEQYTLFGESCPGLWLGFFFLMTALAGILARHSRTHIVHRHVRYTIFATMNIINIVTSLLMVAFVAYTLDRLRFDYPQLCKGLQWAANTYDHVCDYEEGYYVITALLVSMMFLYTLETIVSFIGAIYGYSKVCNCSYKQLPS